MQDENYYQHVALNRTKDINQIQEFIQCSLCQGIAWQPVNCKNCQKPFCSSCIQMFHRTKPDNSCPNNECESFNEFQNFLTTKKLLDKLKIDCRYQCNGCTEVLSYSQLEEHENNCEYQLKLCDGCQQGQIQRDFEEHHKKCRLVSLTCRFCSGTFLQGNKEQHTEIVCVRTQLRQVQSRNEEHENFWNAFFETVQDLTRLNATNQ